MIQDDLYFKNPQGEKVLIKAEVGKYFTPDGSFDEESFVSVIDEYVSFFKNNGSDQKAFLDKAGKWLSEYMAEIVDYLKVKGMIDAALSLFKITVEECIKIGIKNFVVPANSLKNILSRIKIVAPAIDEKKLSKDEKRRNIFNAALQVFGEVGYHTATVDKIAALSGVGKGSVYRYFKSKEELFEQLLVEEYRKITDRISKIFSKDKDVLEQIEEMIEFWIGFVDDNPVVYRLIQSDDLIKDKEHRVMFYEYISNHLPMLKERVVTMSEKKKIKTTSFYTVFYGVFGFIDGVVHKWVRSGMKYSLRNEIPIVKEIVFNGFVGVDITNKRFYNPKEDNLDE